MTGPSTSPLPERGQIWSMETWLEAMATPQLIHSRSVFIATCLTWKVFFPFGFCAFLFFTGPFNIYAHIKMNWVSLRLEKDHIICWNSWREVHVNVCITEEVYWKLFFGHFHVYYHTCTTYFPILVFVSHWIDVFPFVLYFFNLFWCELSVLSMIDTVVKIPSTAYLFHCLHCMLCMFKCSIQILFFLFSLDVYYGPSMFYTVSAFCMHNLEFLFETSFALL